MQAVVQMCALSIQLHRAAGMGAASDPVRLDRALWLEEALKVTWPSGTDTTLEASRSC